MINEERQRRRFERTPHVVRTAAVVVVLVLTACSGSGTTLDGTLVERGVGADYGCTVSQGTPVTVTDATGQVLGVGALDRPEREVSTGDCTFTFELTLSEASDQYEVEVGERGSIVVSADEAAEHGVQLELGP